MSGFSVRIARPEDFPAITALLTANGLPTEDLPSAPARFFLAQTESGDLLACGGVECHGDLGLLRSLAVRTDQRGAGLGTALVEASLTYAQKAGHSAVYLLTNTAKPYFHRRGFATIPRAETPPAIRKTAEFSHLCPDSAVVMCRKL
ncbi:MAG: arsenic resistance N-acetyltransferase ArsN2 [Magnetospiraceae bacterium]